ncbi:MAG: phosphoribosylamine--glycine ligase [Litorimonas sp.]
MKVLLIGSGGREHALAWKLSQSPLVTDLTCAPGNAGIAQVASIAPIPADDLIGILGLVQSGSYEFVVVGPEQPLALGIVDMLEELGVPVFGPTQAAAQLESSKSFTKDFCKRYEIPTADYGVFTNIKDAEAYLKNMSAPYVLKADGLAAGKGVVIAQTLKEAEAELAEFFSGKFGDASSKVVIEEFMHGQEVSFFAISDGTSAIPMIGAQDHKRAFDGDKGPNTGGMGAYAPAPIFTQDDLETVMSTIIEPTVQGMSEDGNPFKGVLFAGLMMTSDGPKLIEYNARFGDPECQVMMRMLESDLMDIFIAASKGNLSKFKSPKWNNRPTVNVVLAAKGYPSAYKKGTEIGGIEAANDMEDIVVFHAGTKLGDDGTLQANGGRVLNITSQASSLENAVEIAYKAIDDMIDWPDGFCRRDIAHHALKQT